MKRGLKITAWVAGGLLAFILLLFGALLIIGNTESGRALIVRLTADLTKGHVQLSGIKGSFPAALDLDRLELRDDAGVWLFAEHISLRWTPMDLLGRHIQVDTLHVSRLHMERLPLPDKNKKPSPTPSIPHSDLAHLSIDALELGPQLAGTAVSLVVQGSAHLKSLQDAVANVVAQRTGGQGDYEIQLRFDPARMDATVKIQEPANGPLENILKTPGLGDLSLLAKLDGPRTAENIDLTLTAGALTGNAKGTINLNDTSGNLSYSFKATAMTPAPGLTWQSIDLQGRWHGTIQAPEADGHLIARELQIPGGTRVAALSANLTANSGLLTLRSTIEGLRIPGPQPALLEDSPLNLNATLRLSDARRPLEVNATHKLFALKGNAVTAGEQSAQLELRVPDVAPFAALGGQQIKGDATIKAQISHNSSSTRLSADATATVDAGKAPWADLLRGGSTRVQVAGNLTDQKITVDRIQLQGRSISASASGTLARTEAQELDARLDLSLPDLAKVTPALAGSLKLNGKVNGPSNSLTAETDLTTTLSIHGSPSGTVSASIHANGLPKKPRGTVEAHGDLDGAPLVFNVSVEQESESTVHAIVHHADWKSAHIEGDLRSGANVAQTRGDLKLQLNQLGDLNRLLGTTLQGSVAGNLDITPGSQSPHARLALDAHNIVTGTVTTNGKLSAEGTLDALNLQLEADSPAIAGEPVNLNSTGRLNLSAHELQVARLEARYHGQTITLLQPTKLSFAEGFTVEGLKLGAQQAVLEASGRVSPTPDIHASLRQLKPELINAFVPNLLASGTIQADAQIVGSFANPTGKVQLDATGLRAANDAARGLPATDIHASAQLMGNAADVDAKLTAGSASQLALKGKTPLAADGGFDLKLTGNLDMGLLNPLLEARGRHVTGALTVDTAVTGSVAAPEIGGKVVLAKGSLRDYTQGTNLSDINGTLTGQHGTLKIENLTARAAPGDVTVEGTVGILQPKIPIDLKVTAKNAQPIANNIITANLNADLKIHGTAREELTVEGKAQINRADVEIPSGFPPNVAVLDVRRPGHAPPPKPEKPLVIKLNITIDAPRQILVKGRGLDSELGGEIRVRGTTDDPIVSGGFELQRGFFTLASSKLTFSNGTVTFNGAGLKNRIDPTLDFTAQTVVQDVTAIVKITGLADQPKIELSSTPDLPQDEILARLLFGEPAAQLTALQVVQIGAALATLSGGGGGLNPVAKIQKSLGLDRLAVGSATNTNGSTTQTNNGASVEAGKYVSSRVYVGVKESTTGASQLAVDVDLTKHLKLQTKLGNGTATAQGTTPENDPGSSVGLAYQFEY